MCKELDDLLAKGNSLAVGLVEHLKEMGAAEGMRPVISTDGEYQVIVRSPEAVEIDRKKNESLDKFREYAKNFIEIWKDEPTGLDDFKSVYFDFIGICN